MRLTPFSAPAAAALLCAGCFTSSSTVNSAKYWRVGAAPRQVRAHPPERTFFGVTRVGSVTVQAPYDKAALAVLRADGSVAFDAYNLFASAPGQLLREPLRRILADDGRFGRVVEPSSLASADATAEILVTDFSLDCSVPGARVARARVEARFLENSGGRRAIALSGEGEGMADASSGDYSAAFSKAFSDAVAAALAEIGR